MSDWISFDEAGFPTDGNPVLVSDGGSDIWTAIAIWEEADGIEGWIWGSHDGCGPITDPYCYELDDDYSFKYWMPLPEPPHVD